MQFQVSRQVNQQRAARTRFLIQLGGLILKSGIAQKLGIEIGADLQKDEEQKKKAYALLGFLVKQISGLTDLEKLEHFGKQFLFDNQDDSTDQELLETSENLVTD